MKRHHLDIGRMQFSVRAKPREGSRGSSARYSFVHEKREDRLIKRTEMMSRILIDIDGDLLGGAFRQHRRPPYLRPAIAAPSHTATYPSTTLPTTFRSAIHRAPERAACSVSYSKLEK